MEVEWWKNYNIKQGSIVIEETMHKTDKQQRNKISLIQYIAQQDLFCHPYF